MKFTYYLFLAFTKLFAIMPFWLLYGFSDVLRFIFYYIIPYRKKVIFGNISRSFPDMTEKEKKVMVKLFYKNLCVIILEGIKGVSMETEELAKRYKFLNPEVMNAYFEKGQDIISVGAHYANWEWGIIAAPCQLKHKIFAFYMPLSNKLIDANMRNTRKKYGTELVPKTEVRKAFSSKKDRPATYFFGADQSPSNIKGVHWTTFLNQDTACQKGHEFFAKHYDLPVIYFDVRRIKRGYYTVKLIVLEERSGATVSGEITEKYMRLLEKIIIEKPEDYLWSHKKWKHKKPQTVN